MAFREVSVIEIREVLRSWLAGAGLRTVAAQAGWTARPPAGMSRRRWRRAWPATAGPGSCPMKGQLREGLTAEEAAVLTYAIPSPDTFRQLLERGWSWNRAEAAITDTLIRTLLRD
jgi:hypothetical protein